MTRISLSLRMILPLLIFMAATQAPATAQTTTIKLGFVDLQEIFQKSNKFLKVREEVDQEMRNKSEKIKQMDSQFRSDMSAFKMQRDLLDEEMAKQRQTELNKEYQQIMGTIKTEEQQFADYRNSKLDPVIKELKTVVEEIAKQEGYGFIFKKAEIGYADEKYNITAKVIEAMNKRP